MPTASTEIWMRRFVDYNQAGFRDLERRVSAEDGTRRVVVIGDSFAFAQGVDRIGDRVSERLEHLVADTAAAPVEVMNVSAPYTHTLQHIEFLEASLEYAPDVVLLLYVFNDIFYLQSGTQPTMMAGQEGGLVARLNPLRALYTNSYLYQQVYLRFRHLYWQFAPRGELPPDPYGNPEVVARHLDDLARFVEVARAAGAEVRIAPFNPRLQLETDRADVERFVQRMVDAGLPVWPVLDAYGDTDYAGLIVSQMDHHPNERAHALLAEAIAPHLEALLVTSR